MSKPDPRLRSTDNNYFNVLIRNKFSDKDILAKYDETRDTVLLERPNEHYLSVIRFDLPLNTVPIFNLKYIDNNPANKLIYSVTMRNGAVEHREYFTNIQVSGSTGIYIVQDFIDIANIAIQIASTAVGIPNPPRISFNPATQLCTIYFSNDDEWKGTFVNAEWQMWFNFYAFAKFAQFQVDIPYGYNGANGKFAKYIVKDNFNGNYIDAGALQGYRMLQEFPYVSQWIDISSVVFTSSRLPINQEDISLRAASGVPAQVGAITDFIPIRTPDLASERTSLTYSSDTPRLVDMYGGSPLRAFDFQIYYVDFEGIFYPLYIQPGTRVSVKIGFYKKSLYSNAWDN